VYISDFKPTLKMKKEKELLDLNESEIRLIDDSIHKAKQFAQNGMLVIVPIFLGGSFIPIGFLPSRRTHFTEYEKTQSLIEYLGFLPWLLIMVSLFVVAVYALLSQKKFFTLKKDKVELKKEKLSCVIKEKHGFPSEDHYIMFVDDTDGKELRIHLSESQYNEYNAGDKIDLMILKNSKILI
jgi:hypothetical protein